MVAIVHVLKSRARTFPALVKKRHDKKLLLRNINFKAHMSRTFPIRAIPYNTAWPFMVSPRRDASRRQRVFCGRASHSAGPSLEVAEERRRGSRPNRAGRVREA